MMTPMTNEAGAGQQYPFGKYDCLYFSRRFDKKFAQDDVIYFPSGCHVASKGT
jgi:hypothetical protein